MPAIYTVTTTLDFAASHIIEGHPGACARLHGHNWKVEVEAQAYSLDEIGVAVDFKTLKAAATKVIDKLDHYHLNDIPPFNTINPTAENVAAYLYQKIGAQLNSEHAKVTAVTLWETDRSRVRYYEE